jgi:hypothetical protein
VELEPIMQLPQIDRNAIRPAGSEVVVPAASRVIPVAPVNPPSAAIESASVVNEINPAVQAHASAQAAEARHAPQADPLQGSGSADAAHKDWTQRKEATVAQKSEAPPKEPMSKMLMEHMHAVWSASARVVEIWMQNNPNQNSATQQQVQVQNQVANRQVDPMAAPGVMAKEVLTYSPSRVKKTEKAE